MSSNFAAEMKKRLKMHGLTSKTVYILLFNILLLLTGCKFTNDIPVGRWHSINGRPMVEITPKGDGYAVTVFHLTHTGSICPVEYPLVRTSTGMYIQGEGRIIVSYLPKKDQLFLSPGGTYIRSGD